MDDENKPRISIEITNSETLIRVENISLSDTKQFDEAYKAARRFLERTPILEKNLENELMLEKGKSSTEHLWTNEENEFKLGEIPTEPEYRIALSLLRIYPLCNKEVDIARETGLLQQTAGNHLRGDRKATQSFFATCDEGYSLTSAGIEWVLKEVIPNFNTEA